ncbi:Com family DNA-binding transcriptional regulator [Pseudomonas sp. MPFS]|uniref:Com family DNA-binding transcriptional regulator n=1 Tax=Pseudomonas sp. MPFS TaxID=2795724 RepID=UPI001F13E899|nr:Com family DNA-binding transcriptional regulator [Pseudomonas sp. MPFS]UMZ13342.1 Com family DNA-binding transcriptional regulator [Pseudomonas sp. MPFS]
MLKECRCGSCKRLLARVGEFTELQIKCSRCGTLNHVKGLNLGRSPGMGTAATTEQGAFEPG